MTYTHLLTDISIFVLLLCTRGTLADFDCICSYSVEEKVLRDPDASSEPIGYLYEFDCKHFLHIPGLKAGFVAVEYEHQLGYVVMNDQMQEQVCPGSPSESDIIPPTTIAPVTSTTTAAASVPTSTRTIPKSTAPKSSSAAASVPSTNLLAGTTATMPPTTQTIEKPTVPTTMAIKTTRSTPTIPTTTTAKTTSATTTATTASSSTTTIAPTTPSTAIATKQTQTTTTASTIVPTKTKSILTTTIAPTTTTTAKTMPTTTTTKVTIKTSVPTTTPTTTKTTTAATTTTTTIRKSTSTTTTAPTTTTTTFLSQFENVNLTSSPVRYIGIGYDLLTGNPGGMGSSSTGPDPGLLIDRRILQLTHKLGEAGGSAREVEYTSHHNCDSRSYVVHDGSGYQSELLQSANLTSHPNSLTGAAFTLNKEFIGVRQEVEANGVIYRDVVTPCSVSNIRYKDELADVNHFMISKDFAADVCKMPTTYNPSQYASFLSKWGTSVVIETMLGTRSFVRYKTSARQLLQQGQASGLVYPTGSYKGYPTSVTFNSSLLGNGNLGTAGTLMASPTTGSQSAPVPLNLVLVPISTVLDAKYWSMVLNWQAYMDVCPDAINAGFLHIIAANLDTAIGPYSAQRLANASQTQLSKTNTPITLPMTWPDGTYGLMEAAIGCPGSHVTWHTGFRKYDTEHTSPKNTFPSDIKQYLSGSYARHIIVTDFCTKTQSSLDPSQRQNWPSGSYCLLKHGSCPSGFQSGFIYWDDNDVINHNNNGGTMPDGQYDKNTKIYYCCRNDGSPTTEIFLPRDRDFVLIRYKQQCQAVYRMKLHQVYVGWDDEDALNKDTAGGAHPYDDGGRHNHKLHFCHYSPAQAGFVPSLIG